MFSTINAPFIPENMEFLSLFQFEIRPKSHSLLSSSLKKKITSTVSKFLSPSLCSSGNVQLKMLVGSPRREAFLALFSTFFIIVCMREKMYI